jgi:hypothetical protein
MMRWLFKQKYRIDRGYQIVGLANLALLLVQSDTLKGYLSLSSTAMLLIGLPSALLLVWCCGYVITLPQVQAAEDRALSDTTQMRRDIDEILRLLHDDKICS